MSIKKIGSLLLAIGFLNISSVCWADQIYFNSGGKMKARILSDEDGKLELALSGGGTMVIDKSAGRGRQLHTRVLHQAPVFAHTAY